MTVSPSAMSQSQRKWSPLRRVLTALFVIVWFPLLLTPCFLLTLASQGELSLTIGGLPGQELRLWLIMDADQRGVGISSPIVSTGAEDRVCLQTNINFVLWQGSQESIQYCECFEQRNDAWISMTTETMPCS